MEKPTATREATAFRSEGGMEGSTWRSVLAMAAFCALESGSGWSMTAETAESSLSGFQGLPGGLGAKILTASRDEERRNTNPAQERQGAESSTDASAEQGKDTATPSKKPESPANPAKEEKTDCDDCVIVRNAGEDAEGAVGGAASSTALAGTLWGLFIVSRPRRTPRTYIRGVSVP